MTFVENYPLVSVIVITYNSSKFVSETLESICAQTYKNIELIVTDDCSSDDTIEVVQKWIDKNRKEFVDVQLVTTEINTGTSANCNRGIKVSHGEWIRIIAGDDLMTPQSIEWQMEYIHNNPEAKIVIGERLAFEVINGIKHNLDVIQVIDSAPSFFNLSAEDQYKYILRHYDTGLTAGTIVNASVYREITLYDEKYSIIEDLPFWLNTTKAGIKYHYVMHPLIIYRMHESVSHAENGTLFNKRFADVRRQIIKDMIRPQIKWYEFVYKEILIIEELRYRMIFKVFKNKRNWFSTIVLKILDYLSFRAYNLD